MSVFSQLEGIENQCQKEDDEIEEEIEDRIGEVSDVIVIDEDTVAFQGLVLASVRQLNMDSF